MLDFASIEEAFPNDDKKKKSKKNGSNDCKPLQTPNYETPVCDNKEVVKNIMEASLNPPNDFKKDGIKAFDFDEYDAYLSVNDIKTNNQDNSLEYRTTPLLADYLKSLRKDFPTVPSNVEQFTNMNMNMTTNIKIDVNLYNLFLFIFLGIIIIILIHQITSLVKE